jgi:AraC family transcriptional regulator of adaptative response/methylated-DNA-[protein]-cysteine methyltransferase
MEATRITAVRTTGIFCLPSCHARPKRENTESFPTRAEALLAGYRACKRCRPLGKDGDGFNEAFQEYAEGRPDRRSGTVVHVARIETPLGTMIAAATKDHLVMLEFGDRRMRRTQFKRLSRLLRCDYSQDDTPILGMMRQQLDEYFAGRRRNFDVPMTMPGTDFQRSVWKELRRIRPGTTKSYAEVAEAIGRRAAVRAVARANGDNRIAILVPCHRVIGSDGSLTGYGGGLWRKQRLLELESRTD